MDRPLCLLVNPAAGAGAASKARQPVEAELRRRFSAFRSETTQGLQHAHQLASAAAAQGELVVTLGGDGLIGAVADALRHIDGSLLGVLPGGRGNDLVRVLHIPRDPVAACAVLAEGEAVALDLGEVEGVAYVGIASVGFDSEANAFANAAPPWLGRLVYAYGALRALAGWRPVRFEMLLDQGEGMRGELVTFTGYSIGAANSKAYGGGMYAAPDAALDDGLLDVVFLEHMPKLRFLTSILPKVFKGTHVRQPTVHVLRARELLISAQRPFAVYADGDEIAQLPAKIKALPSAINVLAPAGVSLK